MSHANIRSSRRFPLIAALAKVTATVALVCAFAGGPAFAQRAVPAPEIAVDELMKPAELPDIVLGNADAKVTIVEYSSLTCPHCAAFQAKVFPDLKKKYIDTGKVRFISREFPLDNLAAAAAMLARCLAPDKAFDFVETMFATQREWAGGANPKAELFKIAKQAGFSEESFEKCLLDQALLDKIIAIHDRGRDTFQVNSTPTFFVNGRRLSGNNRVEDFDKVIEPILGAP